jgi:hypothetical protein
VKATESELERGFTSEQVIYISISWAGRQRDGYHDQKGQNVLLHINKY